jgi:hypothetical protein
MPRPCHAAGRLLVRKHPPQPPPASCRAACPRIRKRQINNCVRSVTSVRTQATGGGGSRLGPGHRRRPPECAAQERQVYAASNRCFPPPHGIAKRVQLLFGTSYAGWPFASPHPAPRGIARHERPSSAGTQVGPSRPRIRRRTATLGTRGAAQYDSAQRGIALVWESPAIICARYVHTR